MFQKCLCSGLAVLAAFVSPVSVGNAVFGQANSQEADKGWF